MVVQKPMPIRGKKVLKYLGPLVITLISAVVRLYQIDKADFVVWDEAHFGKFGSQYLRHEFYFDVHPPLGKLLVGLSGYIANYNGSFEFDSGSNYPDDVDYSTMRTFNALFGILCPLLAYFTARSLNYKTPTVYLISLIVACENSFVTLSRFILLDSMLLFFTASAFMCVCKLWQLRKEELSAKWIIWMFLSGLSIGCVCSVKWVGLFVTALVGAYTICDLLFKHYNPKITRVCYLVHWVVRILLLIILPLVVYLAFFLIHFKTLYKYGEGAASMPTLFQLSLENHDIPPAPRDVTYGSAITIRSLGLFPNLLHSHVQTYPMGSGQQQVTTYGYRDENNFWVVSLPRTGNSHSKNICDRDIIRLSHNRTRANLHTHPLPGIISENHFEVSGYGNSEVGDSRDDWVVEIVSQSHSSNIHYASLYETDSTFYYSLHPISTSFRLRNKDLGCYLATSGKAYPSWGFQQGEVVCKPSFFERDKSTWWNIEEHVNEDLVVNQAYKPPKTNFWKDFVVLNFAMMASNNALVPDFDKQDDLASLWWQWPLYHVGLRMSGWSRRSTRFFLLSNPLIVWASTAAIAGFALAILRLILLWQRQSLVLTKHSVQYLALCGAFPLLGWFLEFAPFYFMGRVTYVHHYLPALYFAIFVLGFMIDFVSMNLGRWKKTVLFGSVYTLVLFSAYYFSPLYLGMSGDLDAFAYLNWLKSWRI